MLGDSRHGNSFFQYAHLPRKERLRIYWKERRLPEFYATAIEDLAPAVYRYLKQPWRYIKEPPAWFPTDEDCEECFSQALESLVELSEENRSSIQNPEAYIWESAKNGVRALLKEMLKERELEFNDEIKSGNENESVNNFDQEKVSQRELDDDAVNDNIETTQDESAEVVYTEEVLSVSDENYTDKETNISGKSATILIEGLQEDIEAEERWAIEVVQEAIKKLRPAERRVVLAILTYGPDYNSSEAPKDLNMSPTTFRAHKSKAYKHLQRIIPKIIQERGIKPRRPEVFDVFLEEKRPFPSEEDDSMGDT